MRGYFSQLARSTGIRVAPARTRAAAPRSATTAAPPHVEEVTFVEQPRVPRHDGGSAAESAAAGDRARRAAEAERARADSQRSAEQRARRDASATSADSAAPSRDGEWTRGESPARARAPRPHDAADERVDAFDAAGALRTSARPTAESQTPETGRHTSASRAEQSRAGEVREGFRPELEGGLSARAGAPGGRGRVAQQGARPDAPAEREATELAAAADGERAAREELVRQYLREVRAWVAASPEPEDVSPEWADEAEESSSLGRRAPRAAESLVAESSISLEPPAARGPEVQDVSLSIGSISIVVEGPQQPVPAAPPPAPPPQTHGASHGESPAPVDLSRYYIRRF